MNNGLSKSKSRNKYIVLAFIFIGLFTLDMIFKGRIRQYLHKN